MEKEIEKEMQRIANLEQERNKKYAKEQNDAPCDACGNKKFVQKFRNVVGDIDVSMYGHFSLFGGSVNGSISGSTKTLPVLSCRECGNEREIKTWKYIFESDKFWDFMHQFYFKVDREFSDIYQIDPFFLERPLETREYMLKNYNLDYNFYNECPNWSTEIWAKAGFKIPKIKKRYFIFWKKDVYPTWKELKEYRKSLLTNESTSQ